MGAEKGKGNSNQNDPNGKMQGRIVNADGTISKGIPTKGDQIKGEIEMEEDNTVDESEANTLDDAEQDSSGLVGQKRYEFLDLESVQLIYLFTQPPFPSSKPPPKAR